MPTEKSARAALFFAGFSLALAASSCNALVDVRPERETASTSQVRPLTTAERLAFSLENLGEVEPGLLYRSAFPDERLLRSLARRVGLKIILDLSARYGKELQSVADEHAPIKRFATVEEMADFFVFLCSERASYAVGSTYFVDGGMLRTV